MKPEFDVKKALDEAIKEVWNPEKMNYITLPMAKLPRWKPSAIIGRMDYDDDTGN